MTQPQPRPPWAARRGHHVRSRLAPGPLLATVACAAAVATLAGCGSGGSGKAAGTGPSAAAAHSMPVSRALDLAASQAQKVTSFTATMDISSSGSLAMHMVGTLAERLKPTVLAHQSFSVKSAGVSVPGGMETLLTQNAVYLKMSSLARTTGKPWVKLSFSSLKHSMGLDLAPLLHQLQGNNPLAQAQMLPAATNVHEAGSGQTVDGVETTEYTGTLDVAKAMTRLAPSLRKLAGPAMAMTGISKAHFSVWIDADHQVRKLVETEPGKNYRVASTMVITSINQPVTIHVPPASQVTSMPGL